MPISPPSQDSSPHLGRGDHPQIDQTFSLHGRRCLRDRRFLAVHSTALRCRSCSTGTLLPFITRSVPHPTPGGGRVYPDSWEPTSLFPTSCLPLPPHEAAESLFTGGDKNGIFLDQETYFFDFTCFISDIGKLQSRCTLCFWGGGHIRPLFSFACLFPKWRCVVQKGVWLTRIPSNRSKISLLPAQKPSAYIFPPSKATVSPHNASRDRERQYSWLSLHPIPSFISPISLHLPSMPIQIKVSVGWVRIRGYSEKSWEIFLKLWPKGKGEMSQWHQSHPLWGLSRSLLGTVHPNCASVPGGGGGWDRPNSVVKKNGTKKTYQILPPFSRIYFFSFIATLPMEDFHTPDRKTDRSPPPIVKDLYQMFSRPNSHEKKCLLHISPPRKWFAKEISPPLASQHIKEYDPVYSPAAMALPGNQGDRARHRRAQGHSSKVYVTVITEFRSFLFWRNSFLGLRISYFSPFIPQPGMKYVQQ